MNSRIHRSAKSAALALTAVLVVTASSASDKSVSPTPGARTGPAVAAAPKPAPVLKRVDINSASLSELQTVSGIGEAEARRIIAARPYPSKAKLAAEKVLSIELYTAIEDRIMAVQPVPKAQAAAKPAGKS